METTTSDMPQLDHGKTVHIYRNGDVFQPAKKFVVNKRIRNFDSFLTDVTLSLKPPFGAVRRIHTPQHGHKVADLDDLESGKKYVAVGAERFKKIHYELVPESTAPKKSVLSPAATREIRPVEHSSLFKKTSGRIRKIIIEPVTIFVYANGNVIKPCSRVLLKRHELHSWEQVFSAITERVTLRTGAIRWLYTMDGQRVEDPTTLKTNECYIAVGSEGVYRTLIPHYGQKPSLLISPRAERDRNRRLPPLVIRNKRRSKASNTTDSSAANSSEGSSSSPARSKPGYRTRYNRNSQNGESDDVFHAKPGKNQKERNEKPVDYDKDEGGLYKSKNKNKETDGAPVVDDSADTQTDLPIDQVPAEEVKDEDNDYQADIPVTVEDSLRKKPSDDGDEETPQKAPVKSKKGATRPDEEENKENQKNNANKKNTNNNNNNLNNKDHNEKSRSEDQSNRPQENREDSKNHINQDNLNTTEDTNKKDGNSNHDNNPDDQRFTDEENAAAGKIQGGYHGYKTRKEIKEKKKKENEAATKIQAGLKGYKARKNIKEQKQKSAKESQKVTSVE